MDYDALCQKMPMFLDVLPMVCLEEEEMVTREIGLLSRAPQHSVCPLPHLLCCGILREPVPVVAITTCEIMPPLSSQGGSVLSQEDHYIPTTTSR